jgi:hypothetical protein
MSGQELSQRDRGRARTAGRLSRLSFAVNYVGCLLGAGLPLAAVLPSILRQTWLVFRGPTS